MNARLALAGALLALAALAVLGLALGACGGDTAKVPPGSTLRTGFADRDGDGVLDRTRGEPLTDRTELSPGSRPVSQLALFAQITDAHVRDEESPARVAFLDRLGGAFESTFRPQEALTSQVLADTVRALDALPLDAVIEGGDLVDNVQADEFDQALTALSGGVVRPGSGAPGYDGVQSASDPDPFFYRPDVDAPRHQELLERAQVPFRARGLRAPWYPVLGNHDVLVQGEFAPTVGTRRIAVGDRRLEGISGEVDPRDRTSIQPRDVERLLAHGLPGPTAPTAADVNRRELSAAEAIARLRSASSHGGQIGSLLDYSFDIGPSVRVVVLDTVRRRAGSEGIVRPAQIRWLRAQLRAAGERWVILTSHQQLTRSAGGARALALLDRDPHVLAAVSGHTHSNSIEPRRSPAGGYWLITTASLVDYPQQARVFRLVRTANGRVALETWMIDHTDADGGDVSRSLSYLDAQGGRPMGFAGGRLDRNVRLYR